ncbi:hypothetical protein K402DRAFT_162654 [Aulographum hederae CBS 113979]|uniref:Zn(2)-C6 fungal-type domain-containing protein n=1 Tax=Aulographum hederae CBS 113979 TaxID=1176131 RepID=A0A6G1GRU4_9PEZI|nr:hypothetical protein K402DRAFT_162654 [Aulographum hederae CBS 113979]
MAATLIRFGPEPPNSLMRLSTSSSPESLEASSESSPSTATTTRFSISFQHGFNADGPDEDDVVPKIEEIEEDELVDAKIPLNDEQPESSASSSQSKNIVKRPRGRPRKHPKSPPITLLSKAPKGRSKTGCITCRRRKKKCDETKPSCLHCQKNNVHCEGYPPKDFWQSGRSKKGRTMSIDGPRELPILIEGIESDLDRFFFEHFSVNVSRVLSLFTDKHNPFKEILLPMATSHRGLMHSLLCLSGSHLYAREPTEQFEARQWHHYRKAVENLWPTNNSSPTPDPTAIIDDPTVAQTLVLCLKSICAGEVQGEYRPHMDAAKHLITTQQSPNQEFQTFLFEFFIYHDVSNSITSLDRRSVLMMDDFHLPEFMIQPEAGAFLGVIDGLFGCLSKIRGLRDRIRRRRAEGLKPLVDYAILTDAQAIDSTLRGWVCTQPADSARWIASMLYRLTTWLYLHRTILPSTPNAALYDAVEQGLEYLRQLPGDSSTQSILLMPTFLLGCAAFSAEQRPEISEAFGRLQEFSNLGNIKYARKVVEMVWELMDRGDESSWDWETIIQKQGWDFLVT